jgi:archaetidylinositol phosphate synthase
MGHKRLSGSILAERERQVLLWLAARTPPSISPDHLTILGLIAGVLAAVGFVACRYSPWFLALALSGLLLNWVGDSLDGTLARYRKIERPRFGYFLDHSCDLIAQTLTFLGLGLSPYFTLPSALFALSMYLLMSSYTYLKVFIQRKHQLTYGGMGATEMRLLIACWAVFALWAGPEFVRASFLNFRALDAVIGVLWILSFAGFMWIVANDLSKFDDDLEHTGSPPEPRTAPIASVQRENETGENSLRIAAGL